MITLPWRKDREADKVRAEQRVVLERNVKKVQFAGDINRGVLTRLVEETLQRLRDDKEDE